MYFCRVIDRFKLHIAKNFKGFKNQNLVLAFSGGVDSRVLFDLLLKSKIDFSVAHCNFNLRATASDQDAIFCADLCKLNSITFYIKKFETVEYSKKNKISIQMAARDLRYSWFNELQENSGYTHILTAHHLDDQLETFLINLGRGSGLKGLRGITTDQIIRPLLPFSKDEIQAYAEENKIEWRADSSNEKDDYLRNQLRHHVIPQWKKTEENLLKQVSTSFENLSLAQEALNVIINDFHDKHFIITNNKHSILLEPLQGLKPQNYFLHELFSPYGFNNVTDLLYLIQAQSGKFLVSNTHRLIRDREQLILTPIEKSDLSKEIKWIPEYDLKAPIQISVESEFVPKHKYALLNADMLKYPLILRKYKKGDYFCPVGMKGKKKLSKYFKDQKFSLLDKESQWVLCSEDQIVWVVGHRVDARFAGNSDTNNPLILKSF